MLGAIKWVMTLNGILSGYKSYVGAAGVFFITLGSWIGADLVPWVNGDYGILELFSRSKEDFILMSGAFMGAGLRKSID